MVVIAVLAATTAMAVMAVMSAITVMALEASAKFLALCLREACQVPLDWDALPGPACVADWLHLQKFWILSA